MPWIRAPNPDYIEFGGLDLVLGTWTFLKGCNLIAAYRLPSSCAVNELNCVKLFKKYLLI